MKKRFYPLYPILLFTVYFIPTNCYAQKKEQAKIDSLQTVLKTAKQDSNKVNTLNVLAYIYSVTNPDTAIMLSNESLHLSEKINWKLGIAKSHHILGIFSYYKGKYAYAVEHYSKALEIWDALEKSETNSKSEILSRKSRTLVNMGNAIRSEGDYAKAQDYYLKSLEITKVLGDKEWEASSLSSIGITFDEQGNYTKALEFNFKALKIAEELDNKQLTIYPLSNIGIIYRKQGNYLKALEYTFKTLKIAEELGNKLTQANELNSIGIIYSIQGNTHAALDYFLKTLAIDQEIGNIPAQAKTLINIGSAYYSQADYPKALDNFLKALKLVKVSGDKKDISATLGNIGSTYIKQSKLIEAYNFIHEALKIATEIGALDLIKEENENLSDLYSKKGNFKDAFEYYKQYITIRDSINNEEKAKKQTRLEMNYEFAKQQDSTKIAQDKKDALAQAELGKQKVIRNAIAGGAGVFVISAMLSFLFYKRKRDAEQHQKETSLHLQVSETEMKALRSQMNPHFIFNALQSIQTFLLSNKSEDANTYLLKFSKLMRLVLENSQHSEVPLKDDMLALELYMQLESIRLPYPFTYDFHIDESVDVENTTIPPLILQPFVENAIWHGLQYKPESGHINIYISKRDNALYATVEDNGVGRDMSKKADKPMLIKKESLGMKLTEERLKILNELKKIKAQLKITDLFTNDNNPAGTKVELSLPSA